MTKKKLPEKIKNNVDIKYIPLTQTQRYDLTELIDTVVAEMGDGIGPFSKYANARMKVKLGTIRSLLHK